MSLECLTGPVVSLEDVRRSFGARRVLRGVTAELGAGKVVGLLGRNGEGKTTLFHIVLDMIEADSGLVEVLGLRPSGSGEIRQRVGYVPDRPTFHEFMDAGDVLKWRRRFFRAWDDERALALARRLDLDLGTPIRGASQGTLGKLAWVCATAHDPALLLLDEPTSGLDVGSRDRVLGELVAGLAGAGKSLLVANHHMEELAGVLDELWVLADGTISGVYDVGTLRRQACRLVGRVKDGAGVPSDPALLPLGAEGPLRQWAALDRGAVERLAAAGTVEGLDVSPLPLDSVFRLLLAASMETS